MDYKRVYDIAFASSNYNLHNYYEPRYVKVVKYVNDNINNVKKIIDIGSGNGTLVKMLKENFNDIELISCDLNKYHNIENVNFNLIDLSNKNSYIYWIERIDLLTCLDVMEHLDKSFIPDVLRYFSKISKNVILTIANHSDIQNGVELHTIQEDDSYWLPLIKMHFNILKDEVEYVINGKPRLYIYYLESII